MKKEAPFLIDINEILKAKTGKSGRKIPQLAIKWLKKIIHQDGVNEVLTRYKDTEGIYFADGCLEYFNITTQIEGLENIPKEGKYVFVSNHPLGGFDGVVLSSVIGHLYEGKIKVLVNDILMYLKPLNTIFIPVNKVGSGQSRDLAAIINQAYESDDQVITFPSGRVSRRNHGTIRDEEWKKSFISKAIEFERDVIPIYFDGKNTPFFYRLAHWRKKLGLQLNIEMLFLADEFFKAKGNHYTIHIGKPIPFTTFANSKSPKYWAEYVKEAAYSLKKK